MIEEDYKFGHRLLKFISVWILILGIVPANQILLGEGSEVDCDLRFSENNQFFFLVTAYTSGSESCGRWADGITASGHKLSGRDYRRVVAADKRYWEYGQKFYLEGVGEVVMLDIGGKIKGKYRLDLYMKTVKEARYFGRRKIRGRVIYEKTDLCSCYSHRRGYGVGTAGLKEEIY